MIVEYVRYRLASTQHEAFEAAYRTAQTALQTSPHCLGYELSRCTEDPELYVLRIEWDSLGGHLEGFRESEEFKGFFRAVKPFVAQLEEMQHYELTAVRS